MEEALKEENDIEESGKKDFDEEIKKKEQKDEVNKNEKEILINPKKNIDIQDLEERQINFKKIISFYIIPEVIFIICFLSGIFYKKFYNIFLFLPYFMPILIFNCCFYNNINLFYLNNYLLLSKLVSIEILIFYPIFIIYESFNIKKDLGFIIIFILGALSGLFSFLYLFIYIYIFKYGFSEFKKIYFLFLELMTIILMHPLLIYTYYMDMTGSTGMISTSIDMFLEIIIIFIFELLLYIINCSFLYFKVEFDNYTIKIIMAIIKLLLYILVEFLLLKLYTARFLNNGLYICSFFRMFFMASSLIFSFIIK